MKIRLDNFLYLAVSAFETLEKMRVSVDDFSDYYIGFWESPNGEIHMDLGHKTVFDQRAADLKRNFL